MYSDTPSVRLFQTRKDKPRLTEFQQRAAQRVKQLGRIYYDQFPNGLPHNGLGVKYARYICRTMAFLPDDRRSQWLERHAAWIDATTRDYILSLGPYWYADRQLGNNLELYDEDRERLQTWSIEAIDVTHEERQLINLEKDRKRKKQDRKKDGATPREQSISRTRPWLAAGYRCRRTWERHGKPVANSSEPSLIITSTKDELATPSQPAVKAVTPATPSKPRRPEPRPVNSTAVHHNEPDPGIRPGEIRDRALLALASRPALATPSKPQGRDRFPADNVIEFPIRKRDADMTWPSGWRMGSRKLPLAA